MHCQGLLAGAVGQQLDVQRADRQVRGFFLPQPVAQSVERVEQQEMGAEQHQAVGEREMRDMRGVALLERLDQMVFAATVRHFAEQQAQLLGEVQRGVEFGGHAPSLASARVALSPDIRVE